MRKVRRPKEPRGRVRFWMMKNVRACSSTAKPLLTRTYTPLWYWHYLQVCAKGEMLALTWPDIDLTRGRLILHETKTAPAGQFHWLATPKNCWAKWPKCGALIPI